MFNTDNIPIRATSMPLGAHFMMKATFKTAAQFNVTVSKVVH